MADIARIALSPGVMRRAVAMGLIVGSIQTLVNQGDAIFAGDAPNFLKVALTCFVTYCVSTHGGVTAQLSLMRASA